LSAADKNNALKPTKMHCKLVVFHCAGLGQSADFVTSVANRNESNPELTADKDLITVTGKINSHLNHSTPVWRNIAPMIIIRYISLSSL
jgi:hypothetical protein